MMRAPNSSTTLSRFGPAVITGALSNSPIDRIPVFPQISNRNRRFFQNACRYQDNTENAARNSAEQEWCVPAQTQERGQYPREQDDDPKSDKAGANRPDCTIPTPRMSAMLTCW